MKILVTGSAGNVGRPVCRELSRRGHEVRGLDRVPTPGLRDAIVADIADEAPVRDAVRGVQAVVFGATGTGKSALLSLILRFYDPGRGRVLVDGIDVRQLDLSSPPGPASCATWSAEPAPRWSRARNRPCRCRCRASAEHRSTLRARNENRPRRRKQEKNRKVNVRSSPRIGNSPAFFRWTATLGGRYCDRP